MNKIDKKFGRTLLPKRPQKSHKGTFGKVLVVAGSKNMMGACLLASKAVLMAGAGYILLSAPEEEKDLIFTNIPEAVFLPFKDITKTKFDIALVGPGLGKDKRILKLLNYFEKNKIPFVLDGDGLIMLSTAPKKFTTLCIFTPHPKEAARLFPGGTAVDIAKKYGCVCVLKGHGTTISDGVKTMQNTTGNSALAKAGTGDVLAGLITGFWAQDMRPFDAAALGVYLHGRAAEIFSKEKTEYSLFASQIVNYIPLAIKELL